MQGPSPKLRQVVKMLLGIFGLALVGGMLLSGRAPREPRWQDYSWREVVEKISSDDPKLVAYYSPILTNMAADAVPYLLSEISSKPARWAGTINRWLANTPFEYQFDEQWYQASDRRSFAAQGFKCLGPLGRAATPELEKLVQEEPTCYEAGEALAAVAGKDALPMLLKTFMQGSSDVQGAALENLCRYGTNAEPALPLILQLSNSTNRWLRLSSFRAMGIIGKNQPEQVLPVLRRGLSTLPPRELKPVFTSITELGPSAAPAGDDLVQFLRNPLHHQKNENALLQLAAEALVSIQKEEALPHLIAFVEKGESWTSAAAINALAVLGTNATAVAPLLTPLVTSSNNVLATAAVYALAEIGAPPELAIPALMKGLRHEHPYVAGASALVLTMYGTNALPALPVLAERSRERTGYFYLDAHPRMDFGAEARSDPFQFALERLEAIAKQQSNDP